MAQDADNHYRKRRRSWELRAQIAIDRLRLLAGSGGHETSPDPEARDPRPEEPAGREQSRADVEQHLETAEDHLDQLATPWTWWRGTRIEGAWGNIDAAWVSLIQVLDDEQLIGVSPQMIAVIEGNLPSTSPQRRAIGPWVDILESQTDPSGTNPGRMWTIRRFATRPRPACPTEAREALATALRGANDHIAAKYHQLRRFQWMVLAGALVLLTLVVTLTVIGWHEPDVIPLCFPDPNAPADVATPAPDSGSVEVEESVVCPSSDSPTAAVDESTEDAVASGSVEPDASERASGADVATVVLFGLIGAALTSVTFVTRQTPTTAVPVSSIRVSQAVLKGAIGMLAAVLGLLFLRAGVVPGFTRIDTRSQLLVYAVVFGASQHLITRLIDARSDSLVEAVSVPAAVEEE